MVFDASGVKMSQGETETQFEMEGSSLIATRKFAKGDVICEIPFSMCIMCHSSGAIRGGTMVGQQDYIWEAAGDLRESVSDEQYSRGRTWDVNLALALLDATCGDGLAGEFWENYTGAYPRANSCSVPLLLPFEILKEMFQDDAKMVDRAMAQKKRLEDLFPSLTDPRIHRLTAQWSHMSPLQFAFAMVRSRCFRLGTLEWFAIVPIIEIANHCSMDASNARFEAQNVHMDEMGIPAGSCILRAKKSIEDGEAISISYDEGESRQYSNRRLMTQYGFSMSENLERDEGDDIYIRWRNRESQSKLVVTDQILNEVIDSLVDSAIVFKMDSGSLGAYTNMETVACAELANKLREMTTENDANTSTSTATKAQVLQSLLEEVKCAEADLPSSFEDDRLLLARLESEDPLRAVKRTLINYRLNLKAPYAVAKTLLDIAASER